MISTAPAQALFQGQTHPLTARGWAMGSAVGSQVQDGAGMLLNPATTAVIPRQWQLSHTRFIQDIRSTAAVWVLPDVQKWRPAIAVHYFDFGRFRERDWEGQETDDFSAGDVLLSGNLARRVRSKLSFGLRLTWAVSHLQDYVARAMLGSLGLLWYDSESTLALGLAYANWGSLQSGYVSAAEPLKSGWTLGFSKHLDHLPLIVAVEASEVYQHEWVLRLGGEFHFGERLFLAWGSSTRRFDLQAQHTLIDFLAGSSVGLGIRHQRLRYDFAIIGLGQAGLIASMGISQQLN